MSIESLKEKLPAFAKDVRLNLSSLASDETMSDQRKYGLLIACGLATRNPVVASALEVEARARLSSEALDAARAAASIMAMNNVYYRFVHLASNKEYGSMPARLRMNVIANPGVDKIDFELWSLAVSAINGCGLCIDSHEKVLREAGVGAAEVHTAVRFAAVIQSAAVALEAAGLSRLVAA
ncbi:carboxymuconolactone decarboxylase family protein [Microvirga lotononidis]|uniref:Alkyl hydroperoxide reductase AhpD n=1 Tax=Microvirga lotononidis TaxID=864069 RepID=I4YR06_9HYPH|nr:carboxymuconolactone decarboxylase family protein [Microvirga lotononidis]EIM26398.1 alkylhydroperoxidase, AhpD family [Microvirga lotononidis]WQO30761.1 carboxymuconolactone decarboxylase family protein [Microvirga lotononidis]